MIEENYTTEEDVLEYINRIEEENRKLRSKIRSGTGHIVASFMEQGMDGEESVVCDDTLVRSDSRTQIQLLNTSVGITLQDITLDGLNSSDDVKGSDWLSCPYCLSSEVEEVDYHEVECTNCGERTTL